MFRKYSSDEHSIANSHHLDETSSLPPPLTVAELMEEESLLSSVNSDFARNRPSSQMQKAAHRPHDISIASRADTPVPVYEYTIDSNSGGTFHVLQPDLSQASAQLTSSPRKRTPRSLLGFEDFDNGCLRHSPRHPSRPHSCHSFQDFEKKFGNIPVTSFRKSTSPNISNLANASLPQASLGRSHSPGNDTFFSQYLGEDDKAVSDSVSFNISPQRVSQILFLAAHYY